MRDETSPDGLIRVEWRFSTGLMSHEINSPRFIDARTGEPFLTLWDEQWDASVRWEGEGQFGFSLRNYCRAGNLDVDVDLPSRTFRMGVPSGEPRPLETIDEAVREAFGRPAPVPPEPLPDSCYAQEVGSPLWGRLQMGRILIAGVLAGLAMFVWESVAHMVLPFGEMGLSSLPNDEAMRAALAAQLGHADGLFIYPTIQMDQTPAPGPWGLLLYHPSWSFSWAVMGWEALVELAMGLTLAFIIALTGTRGFGRCVQLSALVGVAAAIAVSPSYTIWFGFPLAYTAGQMIVAFVDYLVGGAVIALLLKPKPAESAAA